jgi:hypothetical protein
MEISMKLNGVKEIILTPKSEKWKKYSELIEDDEHYIVVREHNSPNIILRQVVYADIVKENSQTNK